MVMMLGIYCYQPLFFPKKEKEKQKTKIELRAEGKLGIQLRGDTLKVVNSVLLINTSLTFVLHFCSVLFFLFGLKSFFCNVEIKRAKAIVS